MRRELEEEVKNYIKELLVEEGIEATYNGFEVIEKEKGTYYADIYEGGTYLYDKEKDILYSLDIDFE